MVEISCRETTKSKVAPVIGGRGVETLNPKKGTFWVVRGGRHAAGEEPLKGAREKEKKGERAPPGGFSCSPFRP